MVFSVQEEADMMITMADENGTYNSQIVFCTFWIIVQVNLLTGDGRIDYTEFVGLFSQSPIFI